MKKKIVTTVVLCGLALASVAQVARPKLVVGLVVDQMRWDYLYYYYDRFGEGGLKRLVDEGYSFENCLINYVPTVTAIGHASVYTGSVPALHGIAGNGWYEGTRNVYCCGDETVRSIGSDSREGQMSPRNLQATTIGDQLHEATDFQSKVIGVALKDRAAILPAGHSADGAYWWDTSAGHFVTSSFYKESLPQWVTDFNTTHQVKPGTDVKTSDKGVDLTFQMAEAALDNERLGQGKATDMLCVSVSSTDAVGHTVGTRGMENQSVYMTLDRNLAHFLNKLDATVGKGNYLLFLSADHGAVHNTNYLRSHHIPSEGMESWTWKQRFNDDLCSQLGVSGKLVLDINAGRIDLDDSLVAKAGLDMRAVRQAAIDWLLRDPRIRYAVAFEDVDGTTIPEPLKTQITNGYFRGRSGDIFYAARPGFADSDNSDTYRGTNHGQWNPYDAHIPFLLFGWQVSHGQSVRPTHIVDIAPTICAMLHIQMPNACVGNAQAME